MSSSLSLIGKVRYLQKLKAEQDERRKLAAPIRSTDLPGLGDLPLLEFIPRLTEGTQAPFHLTELTSELDLAIAPHVGQRFFWFSVPPGHWKTRTLVNALAKHLHRWPESPCGYFSHTDDFATEQSQEVRKIAARSGLLFQRGSDRKDKWALTTGAKFYSGGIAHVDAGIRLRLAVIDDPFKGRAAAESKANREAVFQAIEDDVRPRLLPDGCVVLVHTRWHPDDAIGRYRKRKNWRGKNIPALGGPDRNIPLLPAFWSREHLEALRDENPYSFESLYQGNPIPPGSQLFKEPARFDWVNGLPTSAYKVAYGVDLAFAARSASDWSVCLRLLKVMTNEFEPTNKLDDRGKPVMRQIAHYFVTQVSRAHVDAPSFSLAIKSMYTAQPGPMLSYVMTSEMGGAQFVAERVPGFKFEIAKVDKLQRALRVSEAWNRGRIFVPDGDARPQWVEAFVDELTNFTGVKDAHDDQVDSLAAAYDLLADMGPDTQRGSVSPYESPLADW